MFTYYSEYKRREAEGESGERGERELEADERGKEENRQKVARKNLYCIHSLRRD